MENRVDEAVTRLSSDDPEVRERAFRLLKSEGRRAADALRNGRPDSIDGRYLRDYLLRRLDHSGSFSPRLLQAYEHALDILVTGNAPGAASLLLNLFKNQGEGELRHEVATARDIQTLLPLALGVKDRASVDTLLRVAKDYPSDALAGQVVGWAMDKASPASLRLSALRVLERVGSAESKQCLLALLKDEDEEIRESAILAAGATGLIEAETELRRSARGRPGQEKDLAIGALASLGIVDLPDTFDDDPPALHEAIRRLNATRAIPKLMDRALLGHRPSVVNTFRHLIRINGPMVVSGILGDPDPDRRKMLLEALAGAEEWSDVARMAVEDASIEVRLDALSKLLESRQAVDPAVFNASLSHRDARLRAGALRVPNAVPPATSGPFHEKLLGDPEPSVRHAYLRYLRKIGRPLARERYAEWLKSEDSGLAAEAILALADPKDLLRLLTGPDEKAAEEAADLLAEGLTPLTARDVAALYASGDDPVRARCLRALTRQPSVIGRESLRKACGSGHPPLRSRALRMLVEVDPPASLDALSAALTDPETVWNALDIVEERGAEAATALLPRLEASSAPSWVIGKVLRVAIAMNSRSSGDLIVAFLRNRKYVNDELAVVSSVFDHPAVNSEWASLLSSEDLVERLAALKYFTWRGGRSACPDLSAQLASRFPEVRVRALECLVESKFGKAPSEVRTALTSPHREIREAALSLRYRGKPLLEEIEVRGLLRDPAPSVRDAAKRALLDLGDRDVARDVFILLLAEDQSLLRLNAIGGSRAWECSRDALLRQGLFGPRSQVVEKLAEATKVRLRDGFGALEDYVNVIPRGQGFTASDAWESLADVRFDPVFQGEAEIRALSRSRAAIHWRELLAR